ncbi:MULTISPECIES: SDR family oxidoreductase [unclassified Rhizobium]|uniref:SDR family oxidoreductase n=1 Tax=unclassified Rhizobium TaxID=2613769 RepID=UPI001ADBB660|nr:MULTISPECIES: SDR family oxidoreductase [unclassified Rhizobium]MBO9128051.1 SDR family oxidoreductase [Rhizobium sp. 16-488-2b]MBO9178585.1 SDR family oxidoreductase [Rhizobium sp. 16-488-2a]
MIDVALKKPGRPVIGVAGATGRTGSYLTSRLLNHSVHVVALTRDPNPQRLPEGINRAVVDFDDPNTISKGLVGVDRLFLAQGTSPDQVRNEIAVIDAAVSAGVSHVVKVSAMGPPTRLHPFDWHMEIEAHLAKYDIGYTVLRASTFVDILINRAAKAVVVGTWGGAAGDGRVNLIDTRDVADVAFSALLDERHLGTQRAYHLTGPRAVTMQDVADELTHLLGREVLYRQRTPSEQRQILIASGTSEMVADIMLGLDRIFHDSVLSETTDTVLQLTGRPPRSVESWLTENLSAFRS